MQLTLTTRSYVLFGTGEGHALRDADVVFHPSGFPYVPGRRIKGLLRESLLEVLEMHGRSSKEAKDIADQLFGSAGRAGSGAALRFPNLYLPGWAGLLKELDKLKQTHPKEFHAERLQAMYCAEVTQTAIEEKTGAAKDSSLRTYRVLLPGISFEGSIEGVEALNAQHRDWLRDAAANLRSAGSRRNRGFGEISVALTPRPTPTEADTARADTSPAPAPEDWDCIRVAVHTLEPVLLGMVEGEQNTVGTQQHIPGNVLRGILAELRLRQLGPGQSAHLDPWFHSLLLQGGLAFGPCHLEVEHQGTHPLPLNLQREKAAKEGQNTVHDGFLPSEKALRPVRGQGRIAQDQPQEAALRRAFQFHNSRHRRAAGKSMEGDQEQGIFYYESLAEGQTFTGEIRGERAQLETLLAKVDRNLRVRIGRSRSAQYGSVHVTLERAKSQAAACTQAGTYYLMALSPLVLLNGYGLPSIQQADMRRYLDAAGLHGCKVTASQTAVRSIEQYNVVWQSKTPRVPALDAGSTFRIEVTTDQLPALQKLLRDGLGEWRQLGMGALMAWHQEDFTAQLQAPTKTTEAHTAAATKTTHVAPDIKNCELRKVWEKARRDALLTQVRRKAQKAAQGRQCVPNHLCSRILHELLYRVKPESPDLWEKWVTDVGHSAPPR
jgi:CRISPR-associated protein Csx10